MSFKYKSVNDSYLTFHEVCQNLKISTNEMHHYIKEEKIIPAIFYYLNNGIPDAASIHVGEKNQRHSPRTDIPKLPEASKRYDLAYLHGVVLDSFGEYKFCYVAHTPNLSHFRTKDNDPIEIYKLGEIIPHNRKDAKRCFIFVVEEVNRLSYEVSPLPIGEIRIRKLRLWLNEQPDMFNPHDHKMTQKEVWGACGFEPRSKESIKDFFKEHRTLIIFKKGRPKK